MRRVVQRILPGCDAPDLVRFPPAGELGATLLEALQQVEERQVGGL